MSNRYVSSKLRASVFERANGICEYCMSQAMLSSDSFEVEHIHPRSKGGKTILENLAFSCRGCNGYKGNRTKAIDPMTQKTVNLFNPRKHKWKEHFAWNENFTLVAGLTPTGRATVKALRLNRIGLVNQRAAFYISGNHPPQSFIKD
jgi:hypothetical protein